MKGQYGTIFVQATSAAEGRNGVTFNTFTASAVLMSGEGPVTGSVNSKQFTVTHIGENDIAADDYVLITKTIQGFFVTVPGGGGGSVIEFTFDEDSGAESAVDCADQGESAPSQMLAKVTRRPCGVERVEGEGDDGYVTVVDSAAGGFLEGRSGADISGKSGFATYMAAPAGSYECEWVIIWINWFVEIQVVEDVVIGAGSITISRKNVKVWSECNLPDETVEGTDCATEAS